MDGRFLTAFIIPKEWEIMGYKLKPFSLRMMLILNALDSPFATGKRLPNCPEDIIIFLRVCSGLHPHDAFKKVTLRDRWLLTKMEISEKFMIQQIHKCMEYISVCNTTPKVVKKSETEEWKRENIPGPLSLASSLMKMGFTHTEAWELTLGQAVWYLTAYAVSEGAEIKVITTQQEESMEAEEERLRKFQEEVLAKLKEQRKKNG